MESKQELYLRGRIGVKKFVELNKTKSVEILEESSRHWGTCAFYRRGKIHIDIKACAAIGTAGRSWSFPGHIIDRTPFGVLAHELGHHVDEAYGTPHGTMGGLYSHLLFTKTKEDAITTYAPNVQEWFAEIFRLFITNPDLLRLIRPRMHGELSERFTPVETRPWDEIITAERQRNIAASRIATATRQGRLL